MQLNLSTSGRKLGALVGALLCLTYTLLLGLHTAYFEFSATIAEFLWVVSLHLLYGVLFFMLPSAIIGLATGWLVEVELGRNLARFSHSRATWLGVGFCLTFALVIHVLVWLPDLLKPTFFDWSISQSYLLYLLIPTLIYVVAGGWWSGRLYRHLCGDPPLESDNLSPSGPLLLFALIVAGWGAVQFWLL